ncbi:acyl-CoA dehydrogenase family protein [Roseococcus pinisoli]|uniref:Acyl-CoA/acyl-ACP dehydrogenase n=1 Tax=Roseococcus pinisoli TaxID=2835040 RepID=A0ABS5QFV8_9PROT|nr:acyl-CoA/acyl-ACP dehydrogenase [Roseococcus pinisoli]
MRAFDDDRAALLRRAAQVATGLAATAATFDRTAAFPFEHIEALHAAGLLALAVRREAGGHGAGLGTAQAVVGEVARGDASTALFLVNHYMLYAAIAKRDNWPEDLASRLEREAANHPALINALLAEPELGSASRGGLPGTLARRVEGGWRLSGRKAYCTGIPGLAWLYVLARTDEAETRVGNFVIPARSPGISVIENWDHVGMRATNSHEVVLDDVFVPAADVTVLRPAGSPPDRASTTLLWNAGLLAALYDGIARAARDWLVRFLNGRVPSSLGAPLATLPRMQEAVGRIETQLSLNATLLRLFAQDVDGGAPPDVTLPLSNLLKQLVVDTAAEVTAAALDLTGNHGLSRSHPLERLHRDALCGRIHAPHSELLRTTAGRAALAAGQPGPARMAAE